MPLFEHTHIMINIMNCDAYRILVAGYIDGELSDREMHTLKSHLATCDHCLRYLQRQEAMQTVLKRYSLLQETPEVPISFASKITEQLQELAQQEQPISIGESLKEKGQSLVLQFVERWRNSLKTRPYAWTAAMSCFVMLFVGLLSFQMYQQSYQQSVFPLTAEVSESISPLKQKTPLSADSPEILASRTNEMIEIAPDSPVQFEETGWGTESSEEMPDFIQIDEEGEPSFIRMAQNGVDSVEDYIYSHVVEGYQDRIVDDMVFVGYVQNVFIQ